MQTIFDYVISESVYESAEFPQSEIVCILQKQILGTQII